MKKMSMLRKVCLASFVAVGAFIVASAVHKEHARELSGIAAAIFLVGCVCGVASLEHQSAKFERRLDVFLPVSSDPRPCAAPFCYCSQCSAADKADLENRLM